MATDGELISLLSCTLGSIGQVIKKVSTLKDKYTKEEAHDEILRIYNGYILVIKNITNQ